MSQLANDIFTAETLRDDLKTAVRALGDQSVGEYLTALNDVLNPVLANPGTLDQAAANAIGAALIDMAAAAEPYATVASSEAALHTHLSESLVRNFDVTIDWYEAAGVAPNESGVKRKPEV